MSVDLPPWTRRAAFAGTLLALAGCAIPGPAVDEEEMRARLPHKALQLPAYKLSYIEAGDRQGRLVVFVHGTPGDADGWADYLMNTPSGYHYVSLDRPGFGRSGPEDGAVTSLAEQASAVAALIRSFGAKPAVLVGHSLGGPIVAQTAADSPDLVAALVILAGSLDPAQEDVAFIQFVGDTWPVSVLLPRAIRNANRELIALEHELDALSPRLAAIKVPVTIVHGTKDNLVPFANVAFMKKHLTGAKAMDVTVIEGQNHFLPWNSREQVTAAIAKAFAMTVTP